MIQEIFLDKNRKKNDTPIKDKRNLFRLKKGVKGIKDKVVTNINNIFEYEKEEQIVFGVIFILNTKVMVIKIKYYQCQNIFIKLDHI